MKYLIMIVVLILVMVNSCSTNVTADDINPIYQSVVNFLQKDETAINFLTEQSNGERNPPFRIAISPKILATVLTHFRDSIEERGESLILADVYVQNNNDNNALFKVLHKLEEELKHEPYIDSSIKNINPNDSLDAVVYFSKIHKNFLTLRLFYIRNRLWQLDFILPQGPFLSYLIILKDTTIVDTYTQIMY